MLCHLSAQHVSVGSHQWLLAGKLALVTPGSWLMTHGSVQSSPHDPR